MLVARPPASFVPNSHLHHVPAVCVVLRLVRRRAASCSMTTAGSSSTSRRCSLSSPMEATAAECLAAAAQLLVAIKFDVLDVVAKLDSRLVASLERIER